EGIFYEGEDYLLGELQLSALAQQYLDRFHIHPVYLDCATLLAFGLSGSDTAGESQRPFIPIFIDRFQAVGALGQECFVYVRKQDLERSSEEIVYSGVGLYNREGELCAAFHRLGVKQIRFPGLIRQHVRATDASSGSDERRVAVL